MNSLISGIPQEAKDVLITALGLAYGEGAIELIELESSNLRQRIRLATKGNGSFETVMIVLDSESFALCEDWADDLNKEEKFHVYKDMSSFVEYLKGKLNIELDYEVEEEQNESVIDNSEYIKLKEESEKIIEAYKRREESLMAQIKELEGLLEMSEPDEDVEVSEGLENTESIEDSKETIDSEELNSLKKELETLKKERESLSEELENLKNSKELLSTNLSSTSAELSDFKVKYSTQSGLLNSKDREIENLKAKVEELSGKLVKVQLEEGGETALKDELTAVKKDLAGKDKDYKSLQVNYKNLEKKNSSLEDENKELQGKIEENEKKFSEARDALEVQLKGLKSTGEQIESLSKEINGYEEVNKELSNKVNELQQTITSSEETIVELNKEKIELQNKLSVLEKSTSRDTDIESIMTELTSLRQKYDSMSGNIYTKLNDVSNIDSKLGVKLIGNYNEKFSNIQFVFAGSTESRKGMYKCILNECSKIAKEDSIIIVDVVSETSIDYVFEIKSLKPGSEWFKSGGDVSKYLSNTCLNNTKVLSIGGTKYINDSYFLSMNWLRVLNDLQSLGKNIIVVCGDISNMVGRILHESFSSYGNASNIYVHGNAIGSRSVITNIRGLSNAKDSTICYFEFNKQVQKYVDIAGKTCKTKILNT